ncbi:MAG: DUF3562 domain-containing protein [Candidatus Obscuribacterales bacterium]|nr:DUF3562 domain-containing protein [Steroidobacteraceae bacterium]
MNTNDPGSVLTDKNRAALEALAREIAAPVNEVEEIYLAEHAKLYSTARIKTYVSVFANRRVRSVFEMRHNLQRENVGRA